MVVVDVDICEKIYKKMFNNKSYIKYQDIINKYEENFFEYEIYNKNIAWN